MLNCIPNRDRFDPDELIEMVVAFDSTLRAVRTFVVNRTGLAAQVAAVVIAEAIKKPHLAHAALAAQATTRFLELEQSVLARYPLSERNHPEAVPVEALASITFGLDCIALGSASDGESELLVRTVEVVPNSKPRASAGLRVLSTDDLG
jgi:hypothetical protein